MPQIDAMDLCMQLEGIPVAGTLNVADAAYGDDCTCWPLQHLQRWQLDTLMSSKRLEHAQARLTKQAHGMT